MKKYCIKIIYFMAQTLKGLASKILYSNHLGLDNKRLHSNNFGPAADIRLARNLGFVNNHRPTADSNAPCPLLRRQPITTILIQVNMNDSRCGQCKSIIPGVFN